MDFIGQIANQGGPGWLLFAGSLVVIFILYRESKSDGRKHNEELLDMAKKSVEIQRDNLNANMRLKESVDRITNILEARR